MTHIPKLLAAHDVNELCHLIETQDLSMQGIAEAWGCTKRQLQLWIDGDSDRSQRAKEARQNAADWCDREAERVLRDLTPGATVAEVARARELAQHYRWRARVRNPATHGDKIVVEVKQGMDPALMSDAALVAIANGGRTTIEGFAELVAMDIGTD
jgi:transposase-like protein